MRGFLPIFHTTPQTSLQAATRKTRKTELYEILPKSPLTLKFRPTQQAADHMFFVRSCAKAISFLTTAFNFLRKQDYSAATPLFLLGLLSLLWTLIFESPIFGWCRSDFFLNAAPHHLPAGIYGFFGGNQKSSILTLPMLNEPSPC